MLKESEINTPMNHHLDGIVNITKKKNSKKLEAKSFMNQFHENKKESLNIDNKFDIKKKEESNAFDPEKFLLLVNNSYLTKQ